MILALLGYHDAKADMRVKSFSELTDLDARVIAPKKDPKTGKSCPIVKVVTTLDGFNFDIGAMGAPEAVVYHKELGEIWLYLPVKSAKLKIAHPKYGQFIDDSNTRDGYFWFPNARLNSATSYRLVLEVSRGTLDYDDDDALKTGWMVITSEPSGAEVYISPEGEELQFVGTTPFSKKFTYGSYNYAIRMNMYHSQSGTATFQQERINENFVLSPAFGTVHVTSNPPGTKVTIEGESDTYTTPFTTRNLKSGTYRFKFIHDRYAPRIEQVTVSDGETAELSVDMSPNFATLTINSLKGALITVNGNKAGYGTVTQELVEGIYDIKASLSHHRTASRQVEISANTPLSITLSPTPIYGSIDVTSTPFDAEVSIDGKIYGKTPLTIPHILEGEYDVVLSKPGYATVTQHVTVTEGQTESLSATLPRGRRVNFSGANDAQLYIDGSLVGTLPYSHSVTFGSHAIRIKRGTETSEKKLNVTQGSGEIDFSISFSIGAFTPKWAADATANQQTILSKLVSNLVKVEGGTFVMGATEEQGADAQKGEKPAHQVTLSDFYICKYEVTQAEWEAVMGHNPSKFVGENYPVEQVSWTDCCDFIAKLNRLTGLNFAMPTEAQWEYAARGGKQSRGYKYSGSSNSNNTAWHSANSGGKTHPVGTKSPNELGIYDMSGNVYEWCSDWFGNYSNEATTNPTGSKNGFYRVNRGGSWFNSDKFCRVSYRICNTSDNRYDNLGLRLCIPLR